MIEEVKQSRKAEDFPEDGKFEVLMPPDADGKYFLTCVAEFKGGRTKAVKQIRMAKGNLIDVRDMPEPVN